MEEETTIDLKELWTIIAKRSKLILLITAFCTITSGILSFYVITPVYEASSSIIIGKAPDQKNSSNQSNSNDIYMYQKLIKTYASIAKSDLVADKTAETLGNNITGKQVQGATTVTPQTDTQILVIKCKSKDKELAQNMTNTITNVFISESQKIYPTDSINIMDAAKLPETPVKPKKLLNIAVAFLISLMGSVGLVFMLEYMDSTVKTEEDIEKLINVPVLGIIPRTSEK